MPQTQKQTAVSSYGYWQALAAGAQIIMPEIDCREKLQVNLGIFFGLDSAATPVGCQFLVQQSAVSSGTDSFITMESIITPTTVPTAMIMDGDEVAGTSILKCGTSVPAVNDLLAFKNGTLSQSELREVKARNITVGSESVTLMEGLSFNQTSGTYYTQGQKYFRPYNTFGISRIRVIANNAYAVGSASAIVRVDELSADSIQVIA